MKAFYRVCASEPVEPAPRVTSPLIGQNSVIECNPNRIPVTKVIIIAAAGKASECGQKMYVGHVRGVA